MNGFNVYRVLMATHLFGGDFDFRPSDSIYGSERLFDNILRFITISVRDNNPPNATLGEKQSLRSADATNPTHRNCRSA
jgi:hypothetical protein